MLFFTELWERFSFYGMKTLLVLYMINHFFWSQEDASSLLGTYAALAYGLPVVGGFIADRYLGARRAVILGAVLLSIGHFLMAFEPLPFFYTALCFIIAGVDDAEDKNQTATQIIDYVGKTATVGYLAEIIQVPAGSIFLGTDPDDDYDIKLILGTDWQLPDD